MRQDVLEKTIINKIEKVVNTIIELSAELDTIKQKDLRDKSVQELKETIPLMLYILNGNTNHLEAMIRQIISQKLPNKDIISSFGALHNEISYIIKQAIEKYDYSQCHDQDNLGVKKVIKNDQEAELDGQQLLWHLLSKLLPDDEIIKNYRIRTYTITAFIPRLKLAIDFIEDQGRQKHFKDFYCRQIGIKLIEVEKRQIKDQKLFRKVVSKYIG